MGKLTFEQWKQELLAVVKKETGRTDVKLDDIGCREWYDSGVSPYMTFRETWNNENDCE